MENKYNLTEDLDKFRFNMVALLLNTKGIDHVFAPIEMMVEAMSPDVKLGDLAEKAVKKYNISTDIPVSKENLQPLLDEYNKLMEERKLPYEEIIEYLKDKYLEKQWRNRYDRRRNQSS